MLYYRNGIILVYGLFVTNLPEPHVSVILKSYVDCTTFVRVSISHTVCQDYLANTKTSV